MLRVFLIGLVIAGMVGGYFFIFDRVRLDRFLDGTPLELPATTTEVYKWQDASGRWHISDSPPNAGTSYQVEQYRSDNNVLPLAPIDKKE